MVILITGATGFIGRHLASALRKAGHRVIGVSRNSAGPDGIRGDFTRDLDADTWIPRLKGVDLVINAVGILREVADQTFDSVHHRAPRALFEACVPAGVERVIQISALGADTGTSGYFRSKHAADEYLASLPLAWTIVQPSLVYGEGGTSAKLFTMFASLPLIGVPGRGDYPVQPIHVDDLVAAVLELCNKSRFTFTKVALVGPRAMTFRSLLLELRAAMHLGRTIVMPLPLSLMRVAARMAELSPRSLLDRETLSMLEAGNVADPDATTQLLGRSPRDVTTFIDPERASSVARQAQLEWLLPLLRISIALVWIWTGIVSLGLFPRDDSLELLYRTGVPTALAPLLLYGAAALDLTFGMATLLLRRRRLLWLAQLALIIGYTIIISFRLPEFWLHPYGPILKNLPMLAAIYALYVLEERRWNTSS
jgi:uncharacterized protein YbjT (DUF2867 family)